jgi:MHS family proline/betaine transporter-like MFS transporter
MTVTMPFYLTSIYFISFTQHYLGRATQEAFAINLSAMLAMAVGTPLGALLSDRIGRKRVMIPAALALLAFAHPLFLLMNGAGFADILLLQLIFTFTLGVYMGPMPALLVELFPTSVRYTGMAIAYNLSAAIFGGTAPMVCEWLIRATGGTQAIAWYVMLCCVASLLALLCIRERFKETI